MQRISDTGRIATRLLLSVAVFSLVYNAFLPLHMDEAYYWLWSKHLDWSYYDHPPMVAYGLWLLTGVFGDDVWAIRLLPVACTTGTAWYLYKLGEEALDGKTGLLALALFLALPVTQMAFTVATIDAPLSLFWAMALFYGHRAVKRGTWGAYLATGAAVGAALLSKYTAVLLLGFFALFLLVKKPRALLSLRPWAAVGIALLLFAPVVYWNFRHDWISFAFQYGHGSGAEWTLRYAGEYAAGLFLLFGPLFFPVFLWGIFRGGWWFDDSKAYLGLSTLFVLLFFGYKSLSAEMQLNWHAPAVLGGILFTAWVFRELGLKKVLVAGSALALVLSLGFRFPEMLRLPPSANIKNRVFGYPQAVAALEKYRKPGEALCSDYLTLSSLIAYYYPDPKTVYEPFSHRMSMFKLWDKPEALAGQSCLVLLEKDRMDRYASSCESVDFLESFVAQEAGYRPKVFPIYRCNGFKGER